MYFFLQPNSPPKTNTQKKKKTPKENRTIRIDLKEPKSTCDHSTKIGEILDELEVKRKEKRWDMMDYPRRTTYCPVKLSIFLDLCNKTSWGSMATASKYKENVHITCSIKSSRSTSQVEHSADRATEVYHDLQVTKFTWWGRKRIDMTT